MSIQLVVLLLVAFVLVIIALGLSPEIEKFVQKQKRRWARRVKKRQTPRP